MHTEQSQGWWSFKRCFFHDSFCSFVNFGNLIFNAASSSLFVIVFSWTSQIALVIISLKPFDHVFTCFTKECSSRWDFMGYIYTYIYIYRYRYIYIYIYIYIWEADTPKPQQKPAGLNPTPHARKSPYLLKHWSRSVSRVQAGSDSGKGFVSWASCPFGSSAGSSMPGVCSSALAACELGISPLTCGAFQLAGLH